MNFIQPSIDPVIFSIGFLEFRWYSLAYIIGFILGSIVIKKLNSYRGNIIKNEKLDNFFIWSVLGVILGGRIGYVLFYQFEIFLSNPLFLFEIWNGGMSFHGGLLGIIISIFIFCRINGENFYYLSDLVSVVAPIGIFFGRIANFINTELIGRPTEFYISIIYPKIDNVPRHPSQLYEAFFEGFFLFIFLIIYFIKKSKVGNYGVTSGLFLSFYGFFRFFIEYLREPDHHLGLIFNFMTMGQLLSIPLFLYGMILIQQNANKKTH